MIECFLKYTNNPKDKRLEGVIGDISITSGNNGSYFSFVSKDRRVSINHKIVRWLNDLSLPMCLEAYYITSQGYDYTFQKTHGCGNPLWEMEHNR